MEKELEMGKVSTIGSFQMFLGKILSTIILASGTIILGLFILDEAYGLYTIALIPVATILLFQDLGVGSAMTKYCAQYRTENNWKALRKIIGAGLTFEVITGASLTVFSVLIAEFVGVMIFDNPESILLIQIASVGIFSTSLLAASTNIFVGFERMDLNSYTMICQAITQCVLSPLLVYLGYGALGAIIGYTVASLAASIIAVLLLYFVLLKKLPVDKTIKSELFQNLKPLLRYGIPLAVASILSGILTQVYSFIMASSVDVAMIGNYKIATNFAVLLSFFTMPIYTVLFPAFSKLNPKTESKLIRTVFAASVKYTSLFLVPATLAMMVLSKELIGTIYADKWLLAPFFLSLYAIIHLFAVFGNLSLNSLLAGLGETKTLMKLNILTICIGVPLALLLIPLLGISGLILVTIVAGVPSLFIGLHWAWKRHGTKVDFRGSAKIFLAATIAATATYLFLNVFVASAWLMLTTGLALFLAIYLIAAPLIGAINQMDINNLRAMFSGLGIISKLLEIPLSLVEKPLKMRLQRAEKRNQ